MCKKVKEVWRSLNLEHVRLHLAGCTSALSTLEQILNLAEDDKIKTCLLLWRWWHVCNKENSGETSFSPEDVCYSIEYHVSNVMKIKKTTKGHKQKLDQKWSRPPNGFLKINTDASFHRDANSGGWGFIIRDDQGRAMAVGAGNLANISDALHAEALALLYAIKMSIQMGCDKVLFETDSTQLMRAVKSKDYDLANLGAIIRSIKFQMHVGFSVSSVVSCPRDCNRVAHV